MKKMVGFYFYTVLLVIGLMSVSLKLIASEEDMLTCLIEKLKTGDLDKTVRKLKQECSESILAPIDTQSNKITNFFEQELKQRNLALDPYGMTPYVMTPHRMNYFLPVSFSDNVNRDIYKTEEGWSKNLDNIEVKYQLSFRVPLLTTELFTEGDGIAFAFTLKSWWQLYERSISRPFRETNYQPEFFYYTPLNWQPLQGNTALLLGYAHQSNGHSLSLSRSWNRLYANFIFAKDNYAISFKPWWRIPEGNKVTSPTEPGDDNPDIIDYMGHFELSLVYKWQEYDLLFKGRENFKEQKGYVELGVTFPIYERLKGYIQYTNGYGESLIDYNHSQQTMGIGFSLTDYFQY